MGQGSTETDKGSHQKSGGHQCYHLGTSKCCGNSEEVALMLGSIVGGFTEKMTFQLQLKEPGAFSRSHENTVSRKARVWVTVREGQGVNLNS